MTINEDIELSKRYGEIHDTLNLVSRIGNLKIYSICNIGTIDQHFIVTKEIDSNILIARISMKRLKYLDGDLILSNEEMNMVYNDLTNGSWNRIINYMNDDGKIFINNYRDINLQIPNYKEIVQ